MTAPAQRQVGIRLKPVFSIREGIATYPGSAVFSRDVAILIEHRLTLITQCRFEILMREKLRDVSGRLHDFDLAAHIFDFDVGDRIQQVLHILDVVSSDHVASAYLPFGVALDGQQLIRVSLGNVLSV